MNEYQRTYQRLRTWLMTHHREVWDEYEQREDAKRLKALVKEYLEDRESHPKEYAMLPTIFRTEEEK